jgi:hypothetical protein
VVDAIAMTSVTSRKATTATSTTIGMTKADQFSISRAKVDILPQPTPQAWVVP